MKHASTFRIASNLLLSLGAVHAAVVVDARKPAPPPQALPFETGGRSPGGHVLAINSRYLSYDGKPWFPVMGEFQYSRYPAADWERELLKMKSGGVQIVSTYVFWIHHEEIEGQFDWSGRRDLRRFVELAGKSGLMVWVRVGPWNHAEVRNGGFPDWLLKQSKTRQNDPAYLRYVQRFYGEIGQRLKGLFWKDGGPIAGIQIENEYHERGEGKGEAHILTLKRLAKAAGLDAPFYTVTGWDAAEVPSREVVPVFSGYPDGFWYRSRTALPPSPNYFFTPIRCDENVDDNLCPRRPDMDAKYSSYPFLTAEMAGGMAIAYHRRPVMSADDIAAMEIAKLGSGVTLYGYYMFHGGTNPDGKLTTLQESQATGYPNDLPLKGYDFQAPLGEFGQMRPSFRALKTIHLFLQDFGAELAPMAAYLPATLPVSKMDTETPRVALRSNSKSGYLFINNYQKDLPLPNRREFQVTVNLAAGAVTAPQRSITLPSGAYLFWPIETQLGGAVLEYATAQPLCRLSDPDTTVFFAWPGIDPEFSFHDAAGLSVEAAGARVTRENGRIYVTGITPSLETAIRIRSGNTVAQVLVVSREQAGNIWKARLAGRDRLVYSPADVYFDAGQIHLTSPDTKSLAFGVFPGVDATPGGFSKAGKAGVFPFYAASIEPVNLKAVVKQVAEAGQVAQVRMGPEVALAPTEADFKAAGHWSIEIPKFHSPGVAEVLLRIEYVGDVARLYAGGRLVTDEFFRGAPWEIGLREIVGSSLDLEVLPLRSDAPIYIGNGLKPPIPEGAQAARVTSVTLAPQYQAVADLRR